MVDIKTGFFNLKFLNPQKSFSALNFFALSIFNLKNLLILKRRDWVNLTLNLSLNLTLNLTLELALDPTLNLSQNLTLNLP